MTKISNETQPEALKDSVGTLWCRKDDPSVVVQILEVAVNHGSHFTHDAPGEVLIKNIHETPGWNSETSVSWRDFDAHFKQYIPPTETKSEARKFHINIDIVIDPDGIVRGKVDAPDGTTIIELLGGLSYARKIVENHMNQFSNEWENDPKDGDL